MLRAVGLGGLRQEDCEFETSLGYIGKSYLKNIYKYFVCVCVCLTG